MNLSLRLSCSYVRCFKQDFGSVCLKAIQSWLIWSMLKNIEFGLLIKVLYLSQNAVL